MRQWPIDGAKKNALSAIKLMITMEKTGGDKQRTAGDS